MQQLTVLNRFYLPDASRFLSAGSAGKRVFGRTPRRAAKRSVSASAASVVICLSTCDTHRTDVKRCAAAMVCRRHNNRRPRSKCESLGLGRGDGKEG